MMTHGRSRCFPSDVFHACGLAYSMCPGVSQLRAAETTFYLLSIVRAFEIFPERRYSRRHFEIFTFSDPIATKMITKSTILHGI